MPPSRSSPPSSADTDNFPGGQDPFLDHPVWQRIRRKIDACRNTDPSLSLAVGGALKQFDVLKLWWSLRHTAVEENVVAPSSQQILDLATQFIHVIEKALSKPGKEWARSLCFIANTVNDDQTQALLKQCVDFDVALKGSQDRSVKAESRQKDSGSRVQRRDVHRGKKVRRGESEQPRHCHHRIFKPLNVTEATQKEQPASPKPAHHPDEPPGRKSRPEVLWDKKERHLWVSGYYRQRLGLETRPRGNGDFVYPFWRKHRKLEQNPSQATIRFASCRPCEKAAQRLLRNPIANWSDANIEASASTPTSHVGGFIAPAKRELWPQLCHRRRRLVSV